MKISFFNKIFCSIILLLMMVPLTSVSAEEFFKDISIGPGDISVPTNILKGERKRVYVTVHNNSYFDLSGVVKFYNERTSSFMGPDQPVSILSQGTDDVFMDWNADTIGEYNIAVRVVPWHDDGDNPNNNKVTKKVYVDVDSDGDGVGDGLDNDDDNDGIPDSSDAFRLDSREAKDTDGDGIGDNADPDDDNDGVPDAEDTFPLDPDESKDTDSDGTGDGKDLFPYDSNEWLDTDGDGIGDNADPDDDNHGPIPFINISDTKVRVGESLTFNALKSRDPDGEITKYEWDFGDGMVDTGVIIDHMFEKSGVYIISLKVTDDHDESRKQQIQIRVGMNYLTVALIISTALLIFLLLLLLIPSSRFHHKKMKLHWENSKNN
ncbi:PKD domain-containing protein [candidate division KSB1 bacterium]